MLSSCRNTALQHYLHNPIRIPQQLLVAFQTEEDRPLFRPFTRESLAQIEARIQEENEKKKELEKKRAEGEVRKRERHRF